MTADILARIDAALDRCCACGCGRVLDPDGPSAWFAGEKCQQQWTAAQVGTEPDKLVPASEWWATYHGAMDTGPAAEAPTIADCDADVLAIPPPAADPSDIMADLRRALRLIRSQRGY